MKNRLLLVAALSFTMIGFAQKNEIKAAEKALKSGDAATAQTALEAASGTIAAADEKTQAQYYFTRGKIYSDLANLILFWITNKVFYYRICKRL